MSQTKKSSKYPFNSGHIPKGYRFDRLVVVEPVGRNSCGQMRYNCICDCGNEKVVDGISLMRDLTKSCGCLNADPAKAEIARERFTKHGDFGTRLYKVWANMIARCTNPNNNSYHRYGGRGIYVCDEWKDDYRVFKEWAISSGYDDALTIDRIDDDGPYAPWNCRWATKLEQANNTRRNMKIRYRGKIYTLANLVREVGTADYGTAKYRIEHGCGVAYSLFAKPGQSPGGVLRNRDGFMVLNYNPGTDSSDLGKDFYIRMMKNKNK